MPDQFDDVPALLGSRLCHDLISPIGAIANGMELLEMTMPNTGPEMELIKQSVDNVNARIKFFRIAFGLASLQQMVGRAEVSGILNDYFAASRVNIIWDVPEDIPRIEAKGALLSILCLESALPAGGNVTVSRDGDTWTMRAEAPKLRMEEAAWTHLGGAAMRPEGANSVHFGILRLWADDQNRTIAVSSTEETLQITF